MTTIDELDDAAVLDLSRRTDALGVLSVYVNADPVSREATAIDIKNRYRELQRRVKDQPTGRSREVVAALERLRPEVERLASPTEPGRGRLAFAAIAAEWVVRLDSQMPVPNRVVLDEVALRAPVAGATR